MDGTLLFFKAHLFPSHGQLVVNSAATKCGVHSREYGSGSYFIQLVKYVASRGSKPFSSGLFDVSGILGL